MVTDGQLPQLSGLDLMAMAIDTAITAMPRGMSNDLGGFDISSGLI